MSNLKVRLTRRERSRLIHGCGPEATPAMAASLTMQAETKRLARLANKFAGLCGDFHVKMDMRLWTVDKEIALGGDCYRDHDRDEIERRKDDGMMRVLRAAGKL